ncbi:3917_t:CDS:2 [Funneliformis geosporum]|uniref:3917_t:CDS:1 n=1 Tax=Funneliformis geosporum TaxID=1117311 RepID=A0A9W4WJE8_9GLOM|nr:3917_t:CDS:2 [Funneliformis geosporum]
MILGDDNESSDENDKNEVDNYLKMKSNRKIMPLIWWENNKTKFPFLSQLAKEYLEITVTSISNECLFSAVVEF